VFFVLLWNSFIFVRYVYDVDLFLNLTIPIFSFDFTNTDKDTCNYISKPIDTR